MIYFFGRILSCFSDLDIQDEIILFLYINKTNQNCLRFIQNNRLRNVQKNLHSSLFIRTTFIRIVGLRFDILKLFSRKIFMLASNWPWNCREEIARSQEALKTYYLKEGVKVDNRSEMSSKIRTTEAQLKETGS